jgi:hypothetical protein
MAIKKGNVKQIAKQSVNIVIGDKAIKRKRGKRRPRQTKAKGESQGLQGGFVTPIINYPPAYQYQNPAIVQTIQRPQTVSLVPAGQPVNQARAKLVLPEGETAGPLGIEPQNPVELRLPRNEDVQPPIIRQLKTPRELNPPWLLPEEGEVKQETYIETVPIPNPREGGPTEIYIQRPVRRPGSAPLPPIRNPPQPFTTPEGTPKRGRPKGSKNKPKIIAQELTYVEGQPVTEQPTSSSELFFPYNPETRNVKSRQRRPANIRPPTEAPPPFGTQEVGPVEPPEEITFLGQPAPQRQEPTIERRRQPAGISAAEETFLG